MSSTKCTGIRIPTELYEIARAANPDKTFSEIVICVLKREYSFTCTNSMIDEHESSGVGDVEAAVDNLLKFKRMHQKEEGLNK